MTKQTEANRQMASVRESVSLLVTKISEEGLWDSMKAKDVPEDIVRHVLSEIDLGKDPAEVRRELGIRSQTSKEWQKISAAIKMGYRVGSTTYFHRIFSRGERLQQKLFGIIDRVLEDDIDKLKDYDEKGQSLLAMWAKDITPLIDAYNRMNQGTVKIGKDLGVFSDPASEGKGGGGGVTIVVQSNIRLPSAEEVLKERARVVEAEVVRKKELPQS